MMNINCFIRLAIISLMLSNGESAIIGSFIRIEFTDTLFNGNDYSECRKNEKI